MGNIIIIIIKLITIIIINDMIAEHQSETETWSCIKLFNIICGNWTRVALKDYTAFIITRERVSNKSNISNKYISEVSFRLLWF